MIDRQHLRIVRAIDAEGTMTEAAKSLFLTQSALSHAMKKLEAHFDVPLWKKDGRRLTLTQAGQSVLGLAHRVLPQFEHTEPSYEGLPTENRAYYVSAWNATLALSGC